MALSLAGEFSQQPARPSVLGSEVARDCGGCGGGRASWPLGSWEKNKKAGEQIPAGEPKADCLKTDLVKLRQGLLAGP